MESYKIKNSKVIKQGHTYMTSIPKEVIEALSLTEGDQLVFTIKDNHVSLSKKPLADSQSTSESFHQEMDDFMNQYDETFKHLVDR